MRRQGRQVRAALLLLVAAALVAALPDGWHAAARATTAAAGPEPPAKPNIVLIISDDERTTDQWVMPKTNDWLGTSGTTFTKFFVSNPQCCPSRATFLSGQFSHNNGVWSNNSSNGGFSHFQDASSLPVWLQAAGYHTALIGKYLNGYGAKNETYIPPGWDDWHALVGETAHKMYNYTITNNGVATTAGDAPEDYETDVLANMAVSSIHTEAQSGQPFFLELTPSAPHDGPGVRSADRYKDAFKNDTMPTGPAYNEADVSDKPAFIQSQPVLTNRNFNTIETAWRNRLRMLLALDDLVGRVHDELQADGQLDNTIVIYTGDNGYFLGEHRLPDSKHQPYEEAISQPLIISGPGWPANTAVDSITSNVDIPLTIATAAGATPGLTEDGVPLQSVVSDPQAFAGRALLLETGDSNDAALPFEGVRTPAWKYVEYSSGEKELYDLTNDPYELQSEHDQPSTAAVQAQLASILDQLSTCAGATCRDFLDASAPDTTIDGEPPINDSSSTASFSFSSSDPAATFACSLDGADATPCTSPVSYTLDDGSHSFSVQATNLAGTTDPTPATYTWNIKTNAPDTVIDSGPGSPVNTADADFTFSASEPDATFECALDTPTFTSCDSPVHLSGLADGNHNLLVRARDLAGNIDPTPASWSWLVDTTPPTVTFTTPADGAVYQQYAPVTAAYTCEDALTIVITCSGSVAPGDAIDTAHPGPHTVTVTTSDGAGNSTSAESTYTVSAATGPVAAIGDATIDEGDAGNRLMKFAVTLERPATTNVTVQYATVNGTATAPSDYKAKTGTLTIKAGKRSAIVAVKVVGDTVIEPDETFSVHITSSNATLLDAVGTGTIRDDSTSGPVLAVGDAAAWEGDSGTAQVPVQVTLSRPASTAVTGTWSTAAISATAPSDFKAVTGKAFKIAKGATSATFNVSLNGDLLGEGDETLRIDVSGVTGADVGRASGLVTILDEPSDG